MPEVVRDEKEERALAFLFSTMFYFISPRLNDLMMCDRFVHSSDIPIETGASIRHKGHHVIRTKVMQVFTHEIHAVSV